MKPLNKLPKMEKNSWIFSKKKVFYLELKLMLVFNSSQELLMKNHGPLVLIISLKDALNTTKLDVDSLNGEPSLKSEMDLLPDSLC